jgi:hypothetical protein
MNEETYNEETEQSPTLWDAIVEVITTRDEPLSEIATS